ncbi:hypothetical protein KR074_010454, partial [Drosophila pseudoananassae]
KFEYTNIKCRLADIEFGNFEICHLKSVNRTYKYMAMKLNLNKPVTKVKVANIAIFKKFNGYKPFLYNVTVDACRFLKNPKSYPVFSYFYRFFNTYSNINHTCPFHDNVWVNKLPGSFVNELVTKVLPVPDGDYIFDTNWYTDEVLRATISVYGNI